MTTYTLRFEARHLSPAGTAQGQVRRPPTNTILTFGVTTSWVAHSVVLGGFDPEADRVSIVKTVGSEPLAIRRLRVTGDDGSTYYGAWPTESAITYTADQQDGAGGRDYIAVDYQVSGEGAEQYHLQTEQFEPAGTGLDWYFAPIVVPGQGFIVGRIGIGAGTAGVT